jgi:hypothetical protein
VSDAGLDPRAFVLGKDIHPVELWSPGARVRIRVPAVSAAGRIVAGGLGALAYGAMAAVAAFSLPIPDAARWLTTAVVATAGGVWAARKFADTFTENDATFDWATGRATFRQGRNVRAAAFADIRALVLRGLKTRHEPGEVGGPLSSYMVYWCRLEAELADMPPALILEGDPEADSISASAALDAMGRELARAIGTVFRFEQFREMSAKEYFL